MGRKRAVSQLAEPEEAGINLTPLIDVVFVVLIMFIIVAPMLELDRVQLASAAASQNKEVIAVQENSPIAIHVHADNKIYFNSRLVTVAELLPLLKEAKLKNPKRSPQLYHDKSAHFGTYQSIKNAVELAGFDELDVILQPH